MLKSLSLPYPLVFTLAREVSTAHQQLNTLYKSKGWVVFARDQDSQTNRDRPAPGAFHENPTRTNVRKIKRTPHCNPFRVFGKADLLRSRRYFVDRQIERILENLSSVRVQIVANCHRVHRFHFFHP